MPTTVPVTCSTGTVSNCGLCTDDVLAVQGNLGFTVVDDVSASFPSLNCGATTNIKTTTTASGLQPNTFYRIYYFAALPLPGGGCPSTNNVTNPNGPWTQLGYTSAAGTVNQGQQP